MALIAMKRRSHMKQPLKCFVYVLSLGVILSVSDTAAQDTSPKTLIINRATVDATVIQVGGRSYVDIEGLAQGLRLLAQIPKVAPSPEKRIKCDRLGLSGKAAPLNDPLNRLGIFLI